MRITDLEFYFFFLVNIAYGLFLKLIIFIWGRGGVGVWYMVYGVLFTDYSPLYWTYVGTWSLMSHKKRSLLIDDNHKCYRVSFPPHSCSSLLASTCFSGRSSSLLSAPLHLSIFQCGIDFLANFPRHLRVDACFNLTRWFPAALILLPAHPAVTTTTS